MLQLGDFGLYRDRVVRHLSDNALQRGNVVGQGSGAIITPAIGSDRQPLDFA